MKIDCVSDMHINHHVPFNPNQLKWEAATKQWTRQLLRTKIGTVLVVAGDFSEWNRQAVWFLEVCADQYDQVYYTIGNHDYYLLSKRQRRKYTHAQGRVAALFAAVDARGLPNVKALHGAAHTYQGVTFAGHGLWYDLQTDQEKQWYQTHSNDSRYIHLPPSTQPTHAVLYHQAMEWYASLADTQVDVFVSHVPPVHPPLSPYPYNACYVCPVPFLVGTHWVAGHQHVQGTFEKAGVQIHMQALGYPEEGHPLRVQSFDV